MMAGLSFSTALAHDETPPADPDAWDSSVSLGFTLTDGNSDTTLVNIGLKALNESEPDIWRFEAMHSFGEEEGTTNIDRTTGLAQYKHLFTERWYAGVGLDYLRNDIADVKYRASISGLLGYYLIKNDSVKFNLEVGPGQVFEEVGGVSDDYFAPRAGQRLEVALSETAKFFEEAYITFDVNEGENYLITGSAGLETMVMEQVSLIVSVTDNYDNLPAEGLKRNDLTTITALSYTF